MKTVFELMDEALSTKSAIDLAAIGGSAANAEQSGKYFEQVKATSGILSEARMFTMATTEYNLDLVSVDAFAVQPTKSTYQDSDGADANFNTNVITARPYTTFYVLKDEAIEQSQAGENGITESVYNVMANGHIADSAKIFYFGDEDLSIAGLTGATLAKAKAYKSAKTGWVKAAANNLFCVESAPAAGDEDADPTDMEAVLAATLAAFPSDLINSFPELCFRMGTKAWLDYQTQLKARNTADVDATAKTYMTIPLVHDTALDAFLSVADGGTGRIVILTDVKNMAYGEKSVSFKGMYDIDSQAYKNAFKTYMGSNLIDSDRCVVTFLEVAKPV